VAPAALDLLVEASLEGGKRQQAGQRLPDRAPLELALEVAHPLARRQELALEVFDSLALSQHCSILFGSGAPNS
jgi:hypothetical protein